ncbi:hypothetical protein [Actinocorallia longicatena]|uniref:Uncharacterized protein n=1 Tax=Actinocorallia longicatena TaxID=111803 RepID=A0ABP6QAU1_9ACTN
MSAPTTGSFDLADAFTIVTGFFASKQAHDQGEPDFAEQVESAMVEVFEGLEDHSLIDLSGSFSLIIFDLLDRLAVLSAEPRDDLWQTVIRELTERTTRRNGESA